MHNFGESVDDQGVKTREQGMIVHEQAVVVRLQAERAGLRTVRAGICYSVPVPVMGIPPSAPKNSRVHW